MKYIRPTLGLCALALGLTTATRVPAADDTRKHPEKTAPAATQAAGDLVKVTEKDAAWTAKARAAYPLKDCVVSDEKLGSMGENAEYIYREKGKPDRLIVFCCDGCEDDFKKEPAKYLAKLAAAGKQKPAAK